MAILHLISQVHLPSFVKMLPNFLETVPEERKSLHHFHMFVFLGVHFNAFGVLEHVMSAGSVCIAETQSLSCVLFTFCVMSPNFYWSKEWYELFTSCNVFCMQA